MKSSPGEKQCVNCSCLKFVMDYVTSEKSCINCGTVQRVLTFDINALTFNDLSTNYGAMSCKGSKAKTSIQMVKNHKALCYTERSMNSVTENTRKNKRFKKIMILVNNRVKFLLLSQQDLNLIEEFHEKMDVKYYPRPIELHALILIALATRKSSQISYHKICQTSKTVAAKNLVSFVKTICDSLGIARPVSDPKVMIRKHMSALGLSNRQKIHAFKTLCDLIKNKSSLHPMTHMSVAILISVNNLDVNHTSKCCITSEKIALEVGTSLSTLLSKYEETKNDFKPVIILRNEVFAWRKTMREL